MYEVNFGEAIIYEEDENKLLVDCGAKFYNKGELAYDRVRNNLDKNTQLMITHFDEDHYNGICEIPDGYKFQKIILPQYIYKNDKLCNTTEVFIDTLRTWTYLIALGKSKKISSLHKLFLKLPELVDKIYDIRCVSKDDRIFIGKREIDVLWPQEYAHINRNTVYADEILSILRVSTDDREEIETFVNLADKYVELFIKIYQFYCSNMRDDLTSDINENNFYVELQNLNELFERLYVFGQNLNVNNSYKKRIDSIYSIKIRNMNECSIVFESSDDVIAFGDVSKRIIEYLRKENDISYSTYKVIKVQHHGTKNYWSNAIPTGSIYLISNSGDRKMNWSIYENYGKYFNGNMVCTNDNAYRCDYSKNGKLCSNCNVLKGKTKFTIKI